MPNPDARPIRSRGDRGVVLVLMVMLAFAIMGVLAMGVDLGMAILTRGQMQAAVDTAALEGLRQRDASRGDPFVVRDAERRAAASQIAALVYDADGQLAEGLTEGGEDDTLGAQLDITPPRFVGSGGPGALRRTTTGRSPQIEGSTNYKPSLQLNLENEPHGDLVQGYYVGDDDPLLVPKEGKRYWRSDFLASEAAPEGFDDPDADAFLARMRRTNDFLGLDNIRGVSSAGPPLPLVFGAGGTIGMGNPSREYSYRFHGITVRATAIAQAQPVLTIGAPVLPEMFSRDKAVLGMAGFVLTEKFLRTFEGRGKVRLSNSKLKVKTGEGPEGRERKIGWFVPRGKGLAVGDKVNERDLRPLSDVSLDIIGYVPILDKFQGERGFPPTEGESDWRVVGFGLFVLRGDLEETPRGIGSKDIILRQFRGQVIVSENASAVIPPTFAEPASPGGQLGSKGVELILKRNKKLARAGLGIWAPALVR